MLGAREELLDDFRRKKQQGMDALARGERPLARQCLLGAAESLFRLAQRSDGELKARRLASAQSLVESAKALPETGVGPAPNDGHRGGESFKARERPRVRFADIAGLDHVKELFLLKLVYPFQHREKAQKFGISLGGGVLLFGPPGTGKTMLAQAVANEIDAEFFTVKPSEILSKWVGDAEKNVESLFSAARSYPVSVIFIDELDALAPIRRENQNSVMSRLVPQILAELEGFASDSPNALLFLGATNEPWSIDPAVLRPGRFDEKIYVGLPDQPAIQKILDLNLKGKPLASDVDLGSLAARCVGFSGADIKNVCQRAAGEAFLKEVRLGEECLLNQKALLAQFARAVPSVDPATLRKYEEYAQGIARGPTVHDTQGSDENTQELGRSPS